MIQLKKNGESIKKNNIVNHFFWICLNAYKIIKFLYLKILIIKEGSWRLHKEKWCNKKKQHDAVISLLIFNCSAVEHVTVTFARSGGPGGQNVNKGVQFSFFF